MKKGLIEIIFVQDNNSPIPGFENKVRKCYSNFFSSLKDTQEEIRISLSVFGNEFKFLYNDTAIEKVKVNTKNFTAKGARDVFDSVGNTIIKKGENYSSKSVDEHPEKIIFIIISYGRDNASRGFTYNQVAEMIKHQAEVYNWNFILVTNEALLADQLCIPKEYVIWLNDIENENLLPITTDEILKRVSQIKETAIY